MYSRTRLARTFLETGFSIFVLIVKEKYSDKTYFG